MPINPREPGAAFEAFWREPHYCTLTTPRPDGTPHVVAVGATYDPETGLARVITRKTSRKVHNILAAGPSGARVALCQIDKGRWATLEGVATVRTDPSAIAEAVRRYEERYQRKTQPNPARVAIEIALTSAMGRVG
ncbi:pyridoxamine 5'-phosphate oxidase family protein [Streptantibioticus rubrisoli]|uniref:Pyridoxamine 5'-phosphate oxidase family protein n=1 Tax=Streptantibioticus rubrisoli TaxID=1387313 RepID=A0ABT1PFJ5_9ACTN|nr:pyridoxamine 5'-phosphate oxidase family protein [Streptantibioticus rubrisoli]MCQ4044139.1 pyridoxamine 5'-phosphate oxidase family protein [Streptantibioticus rubrisoli]